MSVQLNNNHILVSNFYIMLHSVTCTSLCLQVRFEFRTLVYARLGGLFFDEVARTMASSFEARCVEQFGPDHLKTSNKKGYSKRLNLIHNRSNCKSKPHPPRVHHEDL